MVVKTKGAERIEFDTIELAAKDAKMGKNILKDVIKKKRLVNGWLYKEEEKVKLEVDKENFEDKMPEIITQVKLTESEIAFIPKETLLEYIERYDGAKRNPFVIDEAGQWQEPLKDFPEPKPFFQQINTIPEDFFITNIKKLTARRKKK